ncbi:4'-phosphopantetheinyl transferase superfamily protein [Bacillus cereus group sp. BfR-BA-01349]|uniref:4'-phosphopantetheinyl transferase family protein n=1 Tax=Bacillus cereus group sp. BfR-BA-01349 TaxID=2920312 RepID=UPI001F5A34AE
MILIVKINIYEYDVTDLLRFLPFLEKETQRQIARLQKYDDKKRTLIGNYMAKYLIAKHTQQDIKDIHFITTKYGKKIVGNYSVSFNISHSGKWVMLALSTNEAIGIDIEKVSMINIGENAHFFNEIEQRYLKELPTNEAQYAFYRMWTAKESFFKCIGNGLSQPLNTCIVPLMPSSEPQFIKDLSLYNHHLQVYSFQIDSEYFCSVCTSEFIVPIHFMTLSKTDFKIQNLT